MAVKIILEPQAPGAQTEVIIRCAQECDREVQQVIALLELQNQRIVAVKQGETLFLAPTEVLSCEAVDGSVYLYLEKEVCRRAAYGMQSAVGCFYAVWAFCHAVWLEI